MFIWMIFSYISLLIAYLTRYILPLIQVTLAILFLVYRNPAFFIIFLIALFINITLHLIFNFREEKLEPINSSMTRKNNSGILLVISQENIRKSSLKNNFYEQDWSAAWINALEQEIGFFSVSDNIKDINNKSKNNIIISRSVSDINAAFIEKNIKDGKTVLIEEPNEKIASYFNVKIIESVKGKKITSGILEGMPLNCSLKYCLFEDFDVLLEIDKNPAIIFKKIGKGKLIFVLFDFSKCLVSLQQGIPLKSYSVRHKHGLFGIIEPADMLPSKKFFDNQAPYADMLENFIMGLFECPRWQKLPSGYSSAIIISHDEDYCHEKFIKMIKEEAAMRIASTLFATPFSSISNKYIDYLKENNVEVAVHWDKFPNELLFRKSLSSDLSKQIKLLAAKVISSRMHFLKFGNHYTNAFRLMIKNGIKVDSTYGINYGKGYGFSTSYFFHPIETNGNLMPILELPFQIMDNRGNATFNYIKALITQNNEKYHGVLCFNFHLSTYELTKELRKAVYGFSKKGILFFTLSQFYDFYNKRANSDIEYSSNAIKVNAKAKLELLVPITHKNIKNILVDGKQIKPKKAKNFFIIPLEKGKHVIKTNFPPKPIVGHYKFFRR